ncbi:hypothetical protein PXD04_08320 [Methanosphaera sp. ISO3-F5]|uniref:hypothetical protein n=1 Tax=Methanosphaera sp. ISO3-F5 TaxID=1452353 RepID=UPI002B261093|nr:hypothetical protein [Methanosphaera sp. ISO3-F5]WQH63698.1 hypothetical protein PXD04_08320 [Methanosphaera sp. ISO3-F5]
MNQERILYGNKCFLIEEDEKLLTYLEDEGFQSTKYIKLPKINYIYVNTESMCYALQPLGVKIATDFLDTTLENAFKTHEFKNIWNILKKHKKTRKNKTNKDRKHLSDGNSSLLVKDEELKNNYTKFKQYLEKEKFKPLKKEQNTDWILINIGNKTYLNNTDNPEIISHINMNLEEALSIKEFKTIWNNIKPHHK